MSRAQEIGDPELGSHYISCIGLGALADDFVLCPAKAVSGPGSTYSTESNIACEHRKKRTLRHWVEGDLAVMNVLKIKLITQL